MPNEIYVRSRQPVQGNYRHAATWPIAKRQFYSVPGYTALSRTSHLGRNLAAKQFSRESSHSCGSNGLGESYLGSARMLVIIYVLKTNPPSTDLPFKPQRIICKARKDGMRLRSPSSFRSLEIELQRELDYAGTRRSRDDLPHGTDSTMLIGLAKLTMLNALKNSERNSNFIRSVSGKNLMSEISTFS